MKLHTALLLATIAPFSGPLLAQQSTPPIHPCLDV